MELSQYMTINEAAETLQLTRQAINWRLKKEYLDGFRIGNMWMVSRASVEEYKKRTRKHEFDKMQKGVVE